MYSLFNYKAKLKQCAHNISQISLHIHVNCLLLIHEFYEITRETQCHIDQSVDQTYGHNLKKIATEMKPFDLTPYIYWLKQKNLTNLSMENI